jgi:hypothetical protein
MGKAGYTEGLVMQRILQSHVTWPNNKGWL